MSCGFKLFNGDKIEIPFVSFEGVEAKAKVADYGKEGDHHYILNEFFLPKDWADKLDFEKSDVHEFFIKKKGEKDFKSVVCIGEDASYIGYPLEEAGILKSVLHDLGNYKTYLFTEEFSRLLKENMKEMYKSYCAEE